MLEHARGLILAHTLTIILVLDREGVPVHMGTRVASFDLSTDGSKVQGIVLADTESTKVRVWW